MLATEREQPKPASTGKGTLATKKQQFDRKLQAFAGYFRVNIGRVQPLQMPVISLILYGTCLTLYGTCLTLALHKNLIFFSVFNKI
ncbi:MULTISPECIES: hypothetical protein [unclassified Microcoleus]|uniref:hypothetical protein n=1 Tax=unclassified Microcoleus TaxID=2642155 RepID=UPI002FD288FB